MEFPGSNIKQFKKVIEIIRRILSRINNNEILSPYSIIPIISQILNLESPMMGSGSSPYSIISFIFELENEPLLKEDLGLSISEKRELIDELYDMIPPYLLKEEEQYIGLLINTKYREFFKDQDGFRKKIDYAELMKEKFSLFSSVIAPLCNRKNGDFAQISHYGYIEDLFKEQSFLKNLSNDIANNWFAYSYPIITEICIRGFKRKDEVKGWIIFIANSTEQLFRNKELRERKILQAARLAEKLGAKTVGMAGLIASFGKGGVYLTEKVKTIGFSTGHAFTVGIIIQIVKKCASVLNIDFKNVTVAIIGAGGSIGSGCAKLMAEGNIKRLILIDTTSIVAHGRLSNLKSNIRKINASVEIILSTEVSDIIEADIVIIATSSLKPIIKSEYLKSGAIVIDDSFPKNVSKEVLREREDIILLEAVVKLPLSLDINATRNMPDLMDASLVRLLTCKEIYGCFAETLTLALMDYSGNYGLGQADPILAKDIIHKASELDFSIAPFQVFGQTVSKERFSKALNARNINKKAQ